MSIKFLKMKKSIFVLGVSTFFSLMSFAQTNKSAAVKSETLQLKSESLKRDASVQNTDDSKYLKTLGISTDNISDALKINNALNDKISAVNSSNNISAAEKQKLIAEYEMKRTSALKGILGEENYKKYEQHISKGKH